MSAEDYKLAVRRMIEEAFNKGEFDVLEDIYDHDTIENQFGLHPGIEGLKEDMQNRRRAFPDFHLTIEDMVVDGDKVWLRLTGRGTNLGGFMGPPNGKSFEITVMDLVRFQDGKIVEHWGVPDRFALLAQRGLLPKAEIQSA